jgi:LacI family transcriptional regulator
LFDNGARRIAFVGGLEGRSVTQERRAGYLEVLSQNGLEPLVLAGRASRAFGREAAHKITSEYPRTDAAICFNDLVALGMLTGFAELGRSVGKDFRIVGFDDIEDCAQSFPTLTSVHCDIAGFGSRIASTAIDWLEEGIVPPPETRTPVELILRKSSSSGS